MLLLSRLGFFLGLFRAFGWRRRRHGRSWMFGFACCRARVMDGAVVVGAHGECGPDTLAVDDDGGFGCFARRYRLGIGVVGGLNLAEVPGLHGTGALFLRTAVAVLDLDKLGTSSDRAVDMGVYLALVAASIQALVSYGVGEERRVVPGAVRTSAARSGDGLKVGSSRSKGASARAR